MNKDKIRLNFTYKGKTIFEDYVSRNELIPNTGERIYLFNENVYTKEPCFTCKPIEVSEYKIIERIFCYKKRKQEYIDKEKKSEPQNFNLTSILLKLEEIEGPNLRFFNNEN